MRALRRLLPLLLLAAPVLVPLLTGIPRALRYFANLEAASGDQYNVRPIDIILDNKLEVWEGAAHYLQAEAW